MEVAKALPPGNRFGELVKHLMCIANHMIQDISIATGITSKGRAAPTIAHMNEGLKD